MAKKKKGNKGLIIIMIVLAVIAFSRGGVFTGAFLNSPGESLADAKARLCPSTDTGANIYDCGTHTDGSTVYCFDGGTSTCIDTFSASQCTLVDNCPGTAVCDEFTYFCSGNDIKVQECGDPIIIATSCPSGQDCTETTAPTYTSAQSNTFLQDFFCTDISTCFPACPDKSTVACGEPISPFDGCFGPCQEGIQCSSGETCESGTCVASTCDEFTYFCDSNQIDINLQECANPIVVATSCPSDRVCTFAGAPTLSSAQSDAFLVDTFCEVPCTDECSPSGQTGCNGLDTKWTCGEANDGDTCLDKITTTCSTGQHCDSSTHTCVVDATKEFEITGFTINKESVDENEDVTATITIKNLLSQCLISKELKESRCNWAVEFGVYPQRLPFTQQPSSGLQAVFTVESCSPDVWTESKGIKLDPGASETLTITVKSPSRTTYTEQTPQLYAFDTKLVPTVIIYKDCFDESTFTDWKTLEILPLECSINLTEICDDMDNDCDGEVNEGNVCDVIPPPGGITDTFCLTTGNCTSSGKCFANEKKTKCVDECAPWSKWSASDFIPGEGDSGCVVNIELLVLLVIGLFALKFMGKQK